MKVAAVQMDIKILEKERNLQHILGKLAEAAQQGAKLIVFPECALSGYCFSSLEEARPVSEPVPGPATERIAESTKQHDCTAVVGLLESAGGLLFNSAAVLSRGNVLGTYRKVHRPYLGIDKVTAPGDTPFPVFDTPHGKLGINICFDCSLPESGRVPKLKGAQILIIPTNWPVGSDTWEHTPHVRATENHFYVIAANRVGEERGFRFAGHSKIVHFSGQTLAEGGENEEAILFADIDVTAADQNRVIKVPGEWEFDRIGGRRPEMYGPLVDPARG